jgi:hypothetical protein
MQHQLETVPACYMKQDHDSTWPARKHSGEHHYRAEILWRLVSEARKVDIIIKIAYLELFTMEGAKARKIKLL